MRALFVLFAVSCALGVSAGPLSAWFEGTAKSYGGPQDGKDPNQPSGGVLSGSCGYGELQRSDWPFWSAAAISADSFLATNSSRLPKGGCGACLQLQCINKPGYVGRCPPGVDSAVTVLVTDVCTDCDANRMAIQYLAFNQNLADPSFGEVAIRFRQVECNPSSNIILDIDQYRASAGGYIRLALEHVAGSASVQAVEIRRTPMQIDRISLASTQWLKLANTYGARWELSGLPEPPLDMRITNDAGQMLIIRQAIKVAGDTGKFQMPVQFSIAGAHGVSDGLMAADAKLPPPAQCNTTLYSYLASDPDLSILKSYFDRAGAAKLLQDTATSATLFAPINEAWGRVPPSVDLSDMETLQHVLLFLISGGQVIMPDASVMLPEDVERGGIKLTADTLQGTPLTLLATPSEIKLSDGSHLTPDAIIVDENIEVCSSVVNKLSEVPMPFP